MLDLHTHFLPEVDDGPATLADTLEILRAAAADGTQVMVATPHNRDVGEKMTIDDLQALLEEVKEAAHKERILIELRLGMENHLLPDLPQQVDEGTALTLGGTHFILVEIPFSQYPPYTDDTIFALQLRGLTPIIAHPERQVDIQQRPQLLRALVERGVLSQVTGESIIGSFGRGAKASARALVKQGLAHVMASDTHAPRGRRTPSLTPAVAAVAKLVGEERAHALVGEIPRAILSGQAVQVSPPAPSQARRFWPFSKR